jgi:hypothetical protein
MKTREKQEDKEINISVVNGSREEKIKNYLIDIETLEPHVKLV